MAKDIATAPLASLLTGREMVRVSREFNARNAPDANRTRAEYAAGLRIIAAELYPGKVSA